MEPNNETSGLEPITSMEEEAAHPMDALLKESDSLQTPKRGETRNGTIAKISDGDILVDIGAKSEGIIPASELEKLDPEQREELAVGQEISVYVVRSGGRGGIVLSLSRAEEEQDWQIAEQFQQSEEVYDGVVAGYNKGGLIVKVGRLRGFLPASQVSLARRRRARGETPDKRWGNMVGEKIIAKVVEVDRRRNRLILSERAASREAREVLKERLISELKPGEVREGHVISLADFGAFVDIGGADGLIHTSELSWKKINHPRDLLKVGDEVQVKVLSLDLDRKRISLSLRELEEDPWDSAVSKLKEGQLIEGSITKLTKFGAFASLAGLEGYDIEGLIHISELSEQRIGHPREVVAEEQVLTVRIVNIDRERRRIGLSLKRVSSAEYAEQDWAAAMEAMANTAAEPVVEEESAAVVEVESPEPIELQENAEDPGAQMPAPPQNGMGDPSDASAALEEAPPEEVSEAEPADEQSE